MLRLVSLRASKHAYSRSTYDPMKIIRRVYLVNCLGLRKDPGLAEIIEITWNVVKITS